MTTGDISIKVDVREALKFAQGLEKQVPFATAVALNRTAEDFLIHQRKHVEREFILRTKGTKRFLVGQGPTNASRISKSTGKLIQAGGNWQAKGHVVQERRDVALKRRQWTRVQVRPPTPRPRNTLRQFEKGGTYSHPAGVPVPARALRPTAGKAVGKAWYPKSLRLMDRRDVVGLLGRKKKGKRRTYRVRSAEGKEYIFQRQGKGKRAKSRLLWRIVPRIAVPEGLDFEHNARKIIAKRWAVNMRGAFDAAMRTARR